MTGLRFIFPDTSSISSLYHHVWFRCDYEKVARPGRDMVVIDVGAHVGLFTLKCARCHKTQLVVAVEPHPINAKLLRLNVRMNNLDDRVKVVEAALGQEEGMSLLYVADRSDRHSLAYDHRLHVPGRTVRVRVITMDNLVKELSIERVDYVKIDINGSVLDVLLGAEEVLAEMRPVWVMEVHVGQLDELLKLLKEYGYSSYPLPYAGDCVHVTALP